MAMLTTAFDVSIDQPHHHFWVMAGFISDAARWCEFDTAWRKRLREDGLEFFHMQPFAQSSKQFKGWDKQEDRRRKLLADLLDLIAEHAYSKFGVIVQSEAAVALSKTFDTDMPAIEVAGRLMAIEVESWRLRNKYQNRAKHIFEDGDVGKGKLRDAVKFANGGLEPLFRSKKDIPEEGTIGFTPLQAADILAFEIKKAAEDSYLSNGQVPRDYVFRFPYRQLNTIPGQPRLWNISSSSDVDELARVDRFLLEHPLA